MTIKLAIPIPLLPILIPEWVAVILLIGGIGLYIGIINGIFEWN